MAWCEHCHEHVESADLGEEMRCPTCGEVTVEQRKTPWRYRIMLAATVVYLAYRAYQGITWVIHHA